MRTNKWWTLAEVERKLARDGYDPSLAGAVRRAARTGCLLWTRKRLVTTDDSRIDARPEEEEET